MDLDISSNDNNEAHMSDGSGQWSDSTEDLDIANSSGVNMNSKMENEQPNEEDDHAMEEDHLPKGQANAIVNLVNKKRTSKTPVKKVSPSKPDYKTPVKCSECGKVYHNARSLERHMNLHLGTYKCDKCGKVCNSTYSLSNHAKIHEGFTGDEVCNVCDKVFCDKSSLNKHTLSVHMGITNYQCQFCSKSFFARRTLAEHERVHTGERPFKCTQCPKSYKRIADLNHHLRLHKGEVSHTCELCGEGFRRVSEMNRHMRKHEQSDVMSSSARPSEIHNCLWCNIVFPSALALKSHIDTHLEATVQRNIILTQPENEEKRQMVDRIVQDLQTGFRPMDIYLPLYPPLGSHLGASQNIAHEDPLMASGIVSPPKEPLMDLPRIKIEIDDVTYNACDYGTNMKTVENTNTENSSSRNKEGSVELMNVFEVNNTAHVNSNHGNITACKEENVHEFENGFVGNNTDLNDDNLAAYGEDTDIEDADEIADMINYGSEEEDNAGINYIIKEKNEHVEFHSDCVQNDAEIIGASDAFLGTVIKDTVSTNNKGDNTLHEEDDIKTVHENSIEINSAKKIQGHTKSITKTGNLTNQENPGDKVMEDTHLNSEGKISRRKRKSVPKKRKVKRKAENACKTEMYDKDSDRNEENLTLEKKESVEEMKEIEKKDGIDFINKDIKKLFCSNCEKTFSSKTALVKHMNLHKGVYSCEICKKVFAAKASLKTHMDIHSGVKVNDKQCNVCGKSFFDVSSLNKHVKSVHMDYKPFSCTDCDLRFSDRKTLTEHIRVHTGERPFICEICGKDFKRKGEMNYHFRKAHTDEQKFTCTECGKGFLRASKLKTHMEFIHSTMPYGCSVCRKHFQSEAHLIDHKRVKHIYTTAEKTCFCDKCGKGFTKKSRLKRHLNSKTDCMASPFFSKGMHKCTYCLREFSSAGERSMHMTCDHLNSETRQYMCTVCGKGFGRRQALKIHMKIHLQIRDYKCEACSATFVQKHHLSQHMRTHTGEKPYQCSICTKQFAQNATLYSHMKHH